MTGQHDGDPEPPWAPLDSFDPYGHFWWLTGDDGKPDTENTVFAGERFVPAGVDLFKFLLGEGEDPFLQELRRYWNSLFGGGKWVAMPERIRNPAWPDKGDGGASLRSKWMDEIRKTLPKDVPKNAIIVGVIDTGVPLHHRRTRMQKDDGTWRSRIVASWQQSATFDAATCPNYNLPFGEALTEEDIDALIRRHSDNETRPLDEDAFKREAKLIETTQVLGHRDLDFRGSHGAHVLDLVAGMDPETTDPELLERVRIVVVNLPPQFLYGTAGNFLQYYASFALQWIVDVAQALWDENHGNTPHADGFYHFPVAVNLSFGMQAGPKNGQLPYEFLLRRLVLGDRFTPKQRGGQPAPSVEANPSTPGDAPQSEIPLVRVAMPVGNSNLDRCTARLELLRDQTAWVPWRVLAQDQTPNFMEIWSDPLVCAEGAGVGPRRDWVKPYPEAVAPLDPAEFRVYLETPTGQLIDSGTPVDQHVRVFRARQGDRDGYANVYCQLVVYRDLLDVLRQRLRLIIALRPSLNIYEPRDTRPEAMAGLWRVGLTSSFRNIGMDVNVQSDQSRLLQSRTGLRSYLDHPRYQLFDDQGRLKDSFDYDPISGRTGYLEAGEGPVRRVGTTNAMASTPYATTIGGYRGVDGKPADYGGTGYLVADTERELRRADVAFPTDDGVAHPGLLAAGASDGSVVPFRGTSMASALATRFLVDALIADRRRRIPGNLNFGRAWYGTFATQFENRRPDKYGPVAPEKSGSGRIEAPESYRKDHAARLSPG